MLTTKQNRIGLTVIASLIALAMLAGCSSKSTLDTTPTPEGAAVNVAASPTSMPGRIVAFAPMRALRLTTAPPRHSVYLGHPMG